MIKIRKLLLWTCFGNHCSSGQLSCAQFNLTTSGQGVTGHTCATMMQMDFRRVEGRFKPGAFALLVLSLLAMLIVVVWAAHLTEEMIDYSVGQKFGLFPSLAVCNRMEHPVEFINYSCSFSSSEYEKIERKPNIAVSQAWEPEVSRSCVYFTSKEEDISMDIEFRVSFKESFNFSAPRQFSAVVSDMILNAHWPSSKDTMGEYAGNMGILPSYNLGAPLGEMMALRVEQLQTTTSDGKIFKKYFAKETRTYHLHLPEAPQEPLPPNERCPKLPDPEVNGVKVVHWGIFIPQPQVVQQQKIVPQWKQIINTLTRAGGAVEWSKSIETPRKSADFLGGTAGGCRS